ncbi:unnamed protein product, partial [marine sediment metagenome]
VEAAPADLTDYVPILLYHKDNSGQGTLFRGGGLYVNCKFAANANERKKLLDKWVAKPVEEIEIRVIAESGKSLDVSSLLDAFLRAMPHPFTELAFHWSALSNQVCISTQAAPVHRSTLIRIAGSFW